MADNGLRCELLMGGTRSSLANLILQGSAESQGRARVASRHSGGRDTGNSERRGEHPG